MPPFQVPQRPIYLVDAAARASFSGVPRVVRNDERGVHADVVEATVRPPKIQHALAAHSVGIPVPNAAPTYALTAVPTGWHRPPKYSRERPGPPQYSRRDRRPSGRRQPEAAASNRRTPNTASRGAPVQLPECSGASEPESSHFARRRSAAGARVGGTCRGGRPARCSPGTGAARFSPQGFRRGCAGRRQAGVRPSNRSRARARGSGSAGPRCRAWQQVACRAAVRHGPRLQPFRRDPRIVSPDSRLMRRRSKC